MRTTLNCITSCEHERLSVHALLLTEWCYYFQIRSNKKKREAAKNSLVTYPGVMMKQSSNNFLMPLLDSNINRCKTILKKKYTEYQPVDFNLQH